MGWLGDQVAIFDRGLNVLEMLDVRSGGLLFDPAGGRLFVADVDRNELVAYSTTTWLPLGTWSTGEDISDGPDWEHDGVMSATADGRLVFLSTSLGIRVIAVGALELTGGDLPE
jgi:hypothetical protein